MVGGVGGEAPPKRGAERWVVWAKPPPKKGGLGGEANAIQSPSKSPTINVFFIKYISISSQ